VAHFSVSSAISFPKSAGEPKSGVPPRSLTAAGIKPSKAAIKFDEVLPLLRREEQERLYHQLTLDILMHDDPDPEFRRELLSRFDTCPCCNRWMGHNRPPSGDSDPPYRRQSTFDFKK
jgi:hypothetical protein